MNQESMQLTLTIQVTYRPNGVRYSELHDLLRQAADLLVGEGRLTGETEAEVETWKAEVKP